ncbi:MAG: PASTA domain-containing protein [Pyrinomonadaceae bacterium]|nr:PASTA domain-containing protein [Pyrinomonadaceae bacterium]
MSAVKTGVSAIGKLITLGVVLAAFLFGMAGVVYMSLSGTEVKVPELVGKDFVESEKELAELGLKLKRRADRPSTEKMNTILEQLPRPGETVKTGQLILVVVSKAGIEGEEAPKSLIKDIETDDTEKIEEMISDKPKKSRSNSNTNANSGSKKADTTRDVIANTATSTSTSNSAGTDADKPSDPSDKKDPGGSQTDKPERDPESRPTRPQASPTPKRLDGDQRLRVNPR